MQAPRLTLAASVIGLAAIGFTASAEDIAPPLTEPPVPIEGETWELVGYRTEAGLSEVLPQARPARLKLSEGRLSGSTGCNRVTASYTLNGSILTLGKGMAATKMACPPPVMEQERAVIRALREVATAHRDGSILELRSSSGEVLLRLRLPETPALGRKSWRLKSYVNAEADLITPAEGAKITLELGPGGRLSGHDGCNNYMGGYKMDGEKLAIGPIATTRMACRGGAELARQASDYAAALGRVAGYGLEQSRLVLRDAEGKPVAVFETDDSTPAQERL